MSLRSSYAGVACALLLACGSESSQPKPPSMHRVLPNLPLPPEAEFVSRAGSDDALQITLFTPRQPASVIDYYRDVLSKQKWRLVSDLKSPDGTVTLYAEQDGPPMWVRIWPTSDKAGTMVELSGAVITKDSGKPNQPKSKTPSKTGS